MQRIALLSCILTVCFLSTVDAQQSVPRDIDEAFGLRFSVVQPDGQPLRPITPEEYPKDWDVSKIPDGATPLVYRYQDKFCVMLVNKGKTAAGKEIAAFGLNSNFGDLSIGIEAPGTKRLPETTVEGNTATFKLPRSKTVIDWNWTGVEATFKAPKERKELDITLAEYGATDKWADVTRIVRRRLSGGATNFRATNILFGGDPAPGVVKSLIVNYTVDDEDKIATFGENAWVRLQYDAKNYFYLLTPKTAANFKFIVRDGE